MYDSLRGQAPAPPRLRHQQRFVLIPFLKLLAVGAMGILPCAPDAAVHGRITAGLQEWDCGRC